jgi:hypothetical protein
MRVRVAVVLLVLVFAGCSSDTKKSLPPPTTTTTTLPSPASRAQVVDMVAASFPESEAFNRGIIRAHWAQVVALLPAELPAPIPQKDCDSGPQLTVRLRNGTLIDYHCKLPPSIQAVRDYMVNLVVNG